MRGRSSLGGIVIVAMLMMLACSMRDPWKIDGAPKAPPDYQFRTGTEAGNDYWLWTCHEGQHVAIVKFSSACYAGAPKLERGPCGTPFEWEEREARRAEELPESLRWPGSQAGPPPRPDGGDDDALATPVSPPVNPAPSASPSGSSPAP